MTPIVDDRVLDHAEGPDATVRADFRVAEQLHERLDHGVRADFDRTVDHAGFGIVNRHPLRPSARGILPGAGGRRVHHLGTCVAAEHFAGVIGFDGDYLLARLVEDRGHVGEVVLSVRVVGGELIDVFVKGWPIEGVETRVDFADFFLLCRRGFFFNDGLNLHLAGTFANHPAVSERVLQLGAEQRHRRFLPE